MLRSVLCCAFGVWLSAVAQTQSAEGADTAIVPLADYHQHLLSPAVAELENRHLFQSAALAVDLKQVLQSFEAHWNDPKGLADLFTADSATNILDGGWKRGRQAVADYQSKQFRAAYRFVPIDVEVTGKDAHLAGNLARGQGVDAKIVGLFALVLAKEPDGKWRIATEYNHFPGPTPEERETAADLIHYLDDAGIRRAVVLSDAYFFDSPRDAPDRISYEKLRAENDWTAEQVAQFPGRLVAFCSLNPLSDYAIKELDRCAASGKFKGLKLHFGASAVDLLNPAHVAKVRAVVAEANRLRLPLVVHVRADSTKYGAPHAQVLLDKIVPAAPDVSFTIAHLWGGEAFSDEALAVYAHAVASRDPRTKNLYFDIAELAMVAGGDKDKLAQIARRMREIGIDRILYGSDGPVVESWTPKESWRKTMADLPLTRAEFQALANNVAPYLR
ncbi:MAG: amidohydrolase family protein [Alphaproteobacteria bacterium]|jgi:predicted TIM-barrel fold metal-dependent hydrolase